MLRHVVFDGGMAAEPQVPIIRMTPEQVSCITENMDSLVRVTRGVNMIRITDEMIRNGVEIQVYKLHDGDNAKTPEEVRQFYTNLLYFDHPNTFEELSNACHVLGYHDINRHFIPLIPSRLLPITRQVSEESDAAQTVLSPNGDDTEEVSEGMNEEQRNLIMSNMKEIADHISHANLREAVNLMSDLIPTERCSYFKNTSHTNSKIVDFFSYVTQLQCKDPYSRLAAAFMRNEHVKNILGQYYSKSHQNIAIQSPPRQANGSGAKPSILTDKQRDINPEVNNAVKHGAYNDQAEFFMETCHDTDDDEATNVIRIKPSRKRMDLDANNKFNRKEVYRCLSNPKGSALVLNIFSYPRHEQDEKERNGSEHDTKNMTTLLKELGFTVTNFPKFPEHLKEEVTAEMFKEAIRNFAQSKDHYHADVCFMVIMAHGEELETSGRGNAILCSDGKSVPLTWIHSQFSSMACKFLIGKPKVFCYQTCRGLNAQNPHVNQYNPKVTSPGGVSCSDGRGRIDQQEAVIKSTLNFNSERLLDDMLVCHAAPQGFQAQRNRMSGSVFIQTIIEVFVEMAHDTHVQRMMVEVDRKIKNMTNETFTQTTTFECIGFDKELYLHPHLYRETEEEPEEGACGVTEKAGTSGGGDC
ncbi:Hypothetical predicted protein [Cloeon dipterum]|uniref:Caspase family p20 domain-containing protein n=1 Tax=Cloeon dipterum TaxID=197152 RepID=A0A8S1D7V2_9INSE|nr:Hypothetical predicted protein [Cloeon dipterum]